VEKRRERGFYLRGEAQRAVQGNQGVGAASDSFEVFDSVTRGRKKMMATPTSGPRVAATRREERRALRPSAADGWAGPLRLAGEELGSRLLRLNGTAACEAGQQLLRLREEKKRPSRPRTGEKETGLRARS
jgi:hypothetical protein